MHKSRILILLIGVSLLAIVGYNAYAVYSGACPCQEFWTPAMQLAAAALLLLIGIVVWLFLHVDTTVAEDEHCPQCRRPCRGDWQHCPDCGAPLSDRSKGVS